MKFLLILAPLVLSGFFVSVQTEDSDLENPTIAENSDRKLIVLQQESVIDSGLEIPKGASFNADLDDSNENVILTDFTSDESFRDQAFDFPEREFPDAPDYYRSANAPE